MEATGATVEAARAGDQSQGHVPPRRRGATGQVPLRAGSRDSPSASVIRPTVLGRVPAGAVSHSPGLAYFFDLAELTEGEAVIDLGSGSGMDVFFAAERVGPSGRSSALTSRRAAREGARIAAESGYSQVEFAKGRIEQLPPTAGFRLRDLERGHDLAPDEAAVFAEAARVLKPGGRLAIADIVSEQQMKESIVCDADLWASCIGGAAQQDAYREAVEGAGLRIGEIRDNPYEFISQRARDAIAKYGVKSVSLLAREALAGQRAGVTSSPRWLRIHSARGSSCSPQWARS